MMMKTLDPNIRVKPQRIALTEQIHHHLLNHVYKGSVPELAKRTRLPYALVYNIIYKPVKSISARHYRMLSGESPPLQETLKVDGVFFRDMVDLWLYLNEDITKSDLYREFFGRTHTKKVDYRIFNGLTATIDPRLEKIMQAKFLDCGLDLPTVRQWIEEHKHMNHVDRVPYPKIRPALLFLHDTIGVHPTFLLNQLFARYESGDLKSVPQHIYQRVMQLKRRVEAFADSGRRQYLEKIKEEIYGRKPGYTLYSEIEEELTFIKTHAGTSPKRYLGRSRTMYEKGKAKRITSSRASKIKQDCEDLIRQRPDLPLNALPAASRKKQIMPLLAAMVFHAAGMLSRTEGIRIEKQILAPAHARGEYEKKQYGFTQFDRAPTALGMKKKAFDLMVAKNCEIFRGIGHYSRRWYLSDLYLKELAAKESFELITAKYELLANTVNRTDQVNTCLI